VNYYTKINSEFLDAITLIAKISDNAEISQKITAYSNFLQAKERAGIERAVGTTILAKDIFPKGAREKFSSLITEQKSYLKTFLDYADESEKEYFKKTLHGNDIDEVNRIRKIILSATGIDGFGVNANYWFAQMAKEINIQIQKISNTIKIDNETINEIDNIMGKIANGFYGYNITKSGASQEIRSLTANINKMTIEAKKKFDIINKYLEN